MFYLGIDTSHHEIGIRQNSLLSKIVKLDLKCSNQNQSHESVTVVSLVKAKVKCDLVEVPLREILLNIPIFN